MSTVPPPTPRSRAAVRVHSRGLLPNPHAWHFLWAMRAEDCANIRKLVQLWLDHRPRGKKRRALRREHRREYASLRVVLETAAAPSASDEDRLWDVLEGDLRRFATLMLENGFSSHFVPLDDRDAREPATPGTPV
jgi:hypothetical protein